MVTIELITQTNYILAVCALGALIATAILVYDLKTRQALVEAVSRYGLMLAFAVTLIASALTLVYSEVFGLIPCGLCWLERAMLYPQVLLIGTAVFLKEKTMPLYGITLSLAGLMISLYHHYIQMGGSALVRCPAAGEGADCAKRFFFEFGFMTFPLMSAILFVFLIALYYYLLKLPKFKLVE